MMFNRSDGRTYDKVRPLNFQYDSLGYADASILFEMGNTKVLVSVSLQNSVPLFLKGRGVGWLTAEYSMLPCATHKRTNRESTQNHRNYRSVEISRLIGRCLRTTVDLTRLGERSLIVDCDVLQADGSTRVACITAASLVLELAVRRWMEAGILFENILKENLAAVSVGIVEGQPLLDLSFSEDNNASVDFNFVLTRGGKIIELQGTSEKEALSWKDFEKLKNLAICGVDSIFEFIDTKKSDLSKIVLQKKVAATLKKDSNNKSLKSKAKKPAFFSLENRL